MTEIEEQVIKEIEEVMKEIEILTLKISKINRDKFNSGLEAGNTHQELEAFFTKYKEILQQLS